MMLIIDVVVSRLSGRGILGGRGKGLEGKERRAGGGEVEYQHYALRCNAYLSRQEMDSTFIRCTNIVLPYP